MSIDRHLQEKIYRLETLRKYQAYYGPNTPYQIIAEINQLEGDLRRMLKADVTRPTQSVQHTPAAKSTKKPKAKPKPRPKTKTKTRATAIAKNKSGPKKKPKSAAKKKAPAKKASSFWKMSQATTDLVATIAFIGMVFLLGAIVFAAYLQTRPTSNKTALAQSNPVGVNAGIVLRPTFTPTPNPNAPLPEGVAPAEVVSPGDSMLPPSKKESTAVPTPVPTLTPSPIPDPTDTPPPPPTSTPAPTQPPPAPPPAQPPPQSAPAAEPASVEPAPPPPPPAPSFPYTVAEQGNRMFQHTNYHVVTVYVAIVSEGNLPIGGLKIVGDHTPTGRHVESATSDWHWSVTNCLDCDYVKFGNVKFEPGVFEDGTWSIYVADEQGNQLSEAIPLTYSADPADWVWDFIIFKRNS